jgi:HTH-type transcriptional regulator/antitoxin HipB
MKSSVQEIAAQIRRAREKRGLTQRALSAKVGIPQSHISKIEQGQVDLQISTLIEIARTLELEVVLVSRSYVSAVEAIQQGLNTDKAIPAYRLPEGEDDDTRY